MRNELFVKSFAPGAAIAAYRIVKSGAANGAVIQATAGTGIGVANGLGAAATDDTVDVVLAGIAEVEYGGNVTRGDRLTADADGKAVKVSDSGIKQFVASGGAAGAIVVTGILSTDELISAIEQDGTSGLFTDLTSEFTISDDDEIDNTDGTATTGDQVIVTYRTPAASVGIALESGVSGDIRGAYLAQSNA